MTCAACLFAMAAALAAGRVTGTQLAELDALVQKMEQAVEADDLGSFYPLNGELHAKLIACAGNPQAQQDLAGPGNELQPLSPPRPGAAGSLRVSNYEHRAIVAALRAGDADAAERLMEQHIQSGQGAAPQNITE